MSVIAATGEHACGTMRASTSEPGDAQTSPALTPLTRSDVMLDDTRRKPITPRPDVMPLDQFPPADRAQIEFEASLPYKPEKWQYFGPGPRPIAKIERRAWYEWHWRRGLDPDKRVRPPLRPRLRKLVIERDGLTCGICGTPVEPHDIHIDHIVAYSRGGSDDPSNLRVTHSLCNIKRGAGE